MVNLEVDTPRQAQTIKTCLILVRQRGDSTLRQWIAKEEKIREEGKGQYENRNEEEPSGHGADGNGGGGH